ncbi:LacI family DNA-binding transcriptional regulator [Mycetocola sp.]|uniref:LacI family DNA-binding transcriptional regulator n=1 Tax=Mycetocola sp. TaxID=1871042 RepID=UPI003988A424
MGRRVTVKDVAAAANVSPSTASRVLSGQGDVDPEMARRVTEASSRLRYSANVMARALRTRQSDTIGVIVPAINNPYFVGVVEALEQALAKTGRSLILCDARDDVDTEARRIDLLQNRMVDGLVIIPVSEQGSAPAISAAALDLPVVQLDRISEAGGTDFVGSDDFEGVRLSIEHLKSHGANTFAYIGALSTTSTAKNRLRAFHDQTNGHPSSPEWILLGDFSTDWGRTATARLLASGPMPDAIVCGADVIALGVLTSLRLAKIDVPSQIKVISHDNLSISTMVSPQLTSIRQPLDVMAEEVVYLLDARAKDFERPTRKSVFTPDLVVRESTLDPESY